MIRYTRLQRTTLFLTVLFGVGLTMFPLWWLVISSFTPELLIFKQSGFWPTEFTLENYINGWKGVSGISFGRYFLNSFFLVGLQVLGTVASSALAGYAFARLEFKFKRPLFAIMLLLTMLPVHVTLIPRYIIFAQLDWLDSYKPLIVPTFFALHGFFVFLIVQFIRGIPRELDEAAIVDGCTPIGVFWYIILPLTKPALVTAAVFAFIWNWNDFFQHLIYISNPKIFTVALGLRGFMDATAGSAFGSMFAMAVLSLIPTFVFFVMAQKLLVEGITTSGLKG